MDLLSKAPAASIGFNLYALGKVNTGWFSNKFVPHEAAVRALNRLGVSFNCFLLCDQSEHWKLVEKSIEEYRLPITKVFNCPDDDHVNLVRNTYAIEAVLIVGDSPIRTQTESIFSEEVAKGWDAYTDYLGREI